MNLSDITTKCWILALFIRDDGERLLLGDGWYDFKQSLQHFQPNSIANDIVELQGTDGQLLAGQVRRGSAQSFDGYIGDATVSKTMIEDRRRSFLQFFRKQHFYKVIYIFPDGSAIQRKRGYLTDAPSVPEMWQKFPEYHVALNFEDVDYYEYNEDSEGDEIFANLLRIRISNISDGGLVWDNDGAYSEALNWSNFQTKSGSAIQITNAIAGSPMSLTQLDGNAEQTTYSGKNLFATSDSIWTGQSAGRVTYSATNDDFTFSRPAGADFLVANGSLALKPSTTYSIMFDVSQNTMTDSFRLVTSSSCIQSSTLNIAAGTTGKVYGKLVTMSSLTQTYDIWFYCNSPGNTLKAKIMLVEGDYTSATFPAYEPFTNGASPNPDYPQAIETVTGGQVMSVVGKNLLDIQDIVKGRIVNGVITGSQYVSALTLGVDSFGFTTTQNWAGVSTNDYIIIPSDVTHLTFKADSITLTGTLDVNVALYDKDKNFITGDWGGQTISSTEKLYDVATKGGGKARYARFTFMARTADSANIVKPRIGLGSTATTYTPYQAQSYEVNLGKNLFDKATVTTGKRLGSDGSFVSDSNFFTSDYISVLPNTTYAYSRGNAGSANSAICYYDSSQTFISRTMPIITATALSGTITTPATAKYAKFCEKNDSLDTAQLERGTVATDYAPYITPIELCKIGTYQDYIWNDSGTWKIHKEIGKVVLDGTQGLILRGTSANNTYTYSMNTPLDYKIENNAPSLSDHFTSLGTVSGISSMMTGVFKDVLGIALYYNSSQTTSSAVYFNSNVQMPTWLASNPTAVYYALETPTDTAITDASLIAQLSTISELYQGINNISLVPSAGAQGTMEIQYATELLLGGGYVWSIGSGGGPTVAIVQGIANAKPIWTVTGQATNPTLTNITTGQSITWIGTVPNGQTLKINMADQTATMAGANVFAQVSGDWLELKPGTNILSYSAGDTTDDSILEWNGVVG